MAETNCDLGQFISDGNLNRWLEVNGIKNVSPKIPVIAELEIEQLSDALLFTQMWETGRFSDFVIIASGSKKFRVHKNVLGTRSSVFAKLFEDDCKTKELRIENFKAESVEEFLSFIYTGRVAQNFNAIEVFALAAKFNVAALKTFAEERILPESDKLKEKAFEEIKKLFPGADLPEKMSEKKREVDAIIET
jgi:hypothetical protein